MGYICKHCHSGYMLEHQRIYVKCPVCGYTEELDEEKKLQYMKLYGSNNEQKKEPEDMGNS